MAPLTLWEEKNTGTNLPAEIKIAPVDGDAYKFMFMAKGGGSANKTFLFQQTPSVLTHDRMIAFLKEKILTLGTSACPPYHLAIVIGGTSAEFALKTAKYASAHYLDNLPTSGSMSAHGFRDLDMEQEILALTQAFGIGAQFGGKYFCHDVRVIRLPRHGASLPVGIAVSWFQFVWIGVSPYLACAVAIGFYYRQLKIAHDKHEAATASLEQKSQ